jgi:hypothetical protein
LLVVAIPILYFAIAIPLAERACTELDSRGYGNVVVFLASAGIVLSPFVIGILVGLPITLVVCSGKQPETFQAAFPAVVMLLSAWATIVLTVGYSLYVAYQWLLT